MLIDSFQNPKYKRLKQVLTTPQAVKKLGITVIEGEHLAQGLVEHPTLEVYGIYTHPETPEAIQVLAQALSKRTGAPCFQLSTRLYSTLVTQVGAGIMVEIKVPYPELPDVLEGDVLYLDGVQDAGNLGTLIRTGFASGFTNIVTSPTTKWGWTPKVLRAGMGAHWHVNLFEKVPFPVVCGRFRGTILAADVRGAQSLFEADYNVDKPVMWVMGNEGQGIHPNTIELIESRLFIPIAPGCESLNVGAAASVCLFDTMRRRLARR